MALCIDHYPLCSVLTSDDGGHIWRLAADYWPEEPSPYDICWLCGKSQTRWGMQDSDCPPVCFYCDACFPDDKKTLFALATMG